MQQLCAFSHYNYNYTWWNFIQCQDATQQTIPYNAEACAQQNGMDYNVINEYDVTTLFIVI